MTHDEVLAMLNQLRTIDEIKLMHSSLDSYIDRVTRDIMQDSSMRVGYGYDIGTIRKWSFANSKDSEYKNATRFVKLGWRKYIFIRDGCILMFVDPLSVPTTTRAHLTKDADALVVRAVQDFNDAKSVCNTRIEAPKLPVLDGIIRCWQAEPPKSRTPVPVYDFGSDLQRPKVDARVLYDMQTIFKVTHVYIDKMSKEDSPIFFTNGPNARSGLMFPL